MNKIVYLLLILFLISPILAHQPRIVYKQDLSENPKLIFNPEVSQAFYGELKGKPEKYFINSTNLLYVQVLAPAIDNAKKDFNLFINDIIIPFNSSNWSKFYEEFAGDNYFQGPEYNDGSGQYLIIINNSDNYGKYVLVVGKKESFPLNEAINSIISLPFLKIYFNKSPLTAFFNMIGLFMLILLLVIIFLIVSIYFIWRKYATR